MSIILAVVQAAKPAVQAVVPFVPTPMQHVVQFPQMWLAFWAWAVGLLSGGALMGWFRNRGVKGMVVDVQRDVSTIKDKVQAITEPTKVTPVPVTNVTVT
jgi:hypothetical protein